MLSYVYSAFEDEKKRNCKKSLEIAKNLMDQSKDTASFASSYPALASAYACNGQFDQAIMNQQTAIDILKRTDAAIKNREKQNSILDLYKNKQPFVDNGQWY